MWLFVGAGVVGAVVLLGLIGAFLAAPNATPTPFATASPIPSAPPAETLAPTSPPTQEPTTPPTQLDYLLRPNYGSTSLLSGFAPPPYQITFTTGGAIDVSYLMNDADHGGGDCIGDASAAPDFHLDYLDGEAPPFLWIYFSGSADTDTALVVNDPNGKWYCDNDSLDDVTNPWVSLDPFIGRYDIWVTSLSGAPIYGTLYIDEEPQ